MAAITEQVWLYFAGPAKANEAETRALAHAGFIWRSGHAKNGGRIANVQHVQPSDLILLVFQGRPQGLFRVKDTGPAAVPGFPALGYAPDELCSHLSSIGYTQDPELNLHTGFFVEIDGTGDPELLDSSYKSGGQGALHRIENVAKEAAPRPPERPSALDPRPQPWTFAERPPSPTLPMTEWWFLGVDVGYSEHRESLGHCVLHIVSDGTLEVADSGVSGLETFLQQGLPTILLRQDFDVIALDGPICPAGRPLNGPWYRPNERLLLQRELPRRIKAQPYRSPVGCDLTDATARIGAICQASGYSHRGFSDLRHDVSRVIVEAFPKLWLGLTLDHAHVDARLSDRGVLRDHADHSMAKWIVYEKVATAFVRRLHEEAGVALRRGLGWDTALANRDSAAALVSALTALLLRMGWASVIGNDEFGYFVVPASPFWGADWIRLLGEAARRFEPDSGGPVLLRDPV